MLFAINQLLLAQEDNASLLGNALPKGIEC
jgi:hypothetical protein